jgi:putative membrane protein
VGPTSTHLIQLIPPAIVMLLLCMACVNFYRQYVLKSRELAEVVSKVGSTVRSMSEGDDFMRKDGVARVFQGTMLEKAWKDFAKTLHPQTGMINGVKRNRKFRLTVPVTMHFSASTVIDRPLGVEYFKHLPGILTGIGIIGTFAGLLFGLSNFDSSSVEKMNESITLLISGVRDAFYASAAAIAAAMVITHWEKSLYRKNLAALDDLVDAMNGLFEPGVGEEYLATLVHHSASSGNVTKDLKDDLLQAMLPVIKQMESMHNQGDDGFAKSLERVITESNKRLVSQLEVVLSRQVKIPIEEMSTRLENRLSHIRSNPQDLAMKVIRARQSDNYTETNSTAEPL